nr:uracil nucleotide/cysteinyl leukotriene receptor-like [Misgurnus anguillicaudatus]
MNNSTLNFNITESPPDSTTPFIGLTTSLFMCILSINVLFGLPAHSYVIYLIITGSATASEFYKLNLFVCEIGMCLNCVFRMLAVWFSGFKELVSFFVGLGITGRPLFECLICFERYLAVVHPVTFLKYKPLRYKVICCTIAWIITLGSCLSIMFLLVYVYDLAIYTLVFLIKSLVYFFIQLYCCVAVLRALKQPGPGERGREREEINHMKRKAFYLILITTVKMFIIYVLFAFTALFRIMTQTYVEESHLITVVFVLSGFVHPVLYLHRAGKLCCSSSP